MVKTARNFNPSFHLLQLLQQQYNFEERGVIEIKGKGEMKTYFLTERNFSAL
ncbi:adenylate/guanylate cyclase domain-containing protein [Oscillatoria acuminata]|uniref:adenylate/guanylate cyclase domain-containing protein n=1 Tax=Oscillatoria acuminata TaxID=118323 RepID=UPI00031B4892|nr:adenylate/guanylate cyclase domain-containing protein [Oscillatoria acuminata]